MAYNIKGFRLKNKDEVSVEIISVLEKCNDECLGKILKSKEFSDNMEEQKNKGHVKNQNTKQVKFLGAKFRLQIRDLINELQVCDLHFIRCIKPNENKKANMFNFSFVLLQV